MKNLFKLLPNLFNRKQTISKRKLFSLYAPSASIPEAFDYPDQEFEKLVNELTFFIKPDDRILTFVNYLESPLFQQYELDVNNPNHAAVLGYAFCLAIVLQHELMQKTVIEDVLTKFAKAKTPGNKVS